MGILDSFTSPSAQKPRPIFTRENCINRRQRKHKCTVCTDICPVGVFSMDPSKPSDWDKCLNCGLCVSVCPSRCFAPDTSTQMLYTHNLKLDKPISFSCERDDKLCDRTVSCLAGVPWELLAALSLHTDIVIYTSACDSCNNAKKPAQLGKNLELLRGFLGEELFSRRVHILKDGEFTREQADKTKSRRELFSDIKSSVIKSAAGYAASKLPIPGEDDADGLRYRKILSSTVLSFRKEAPSASFGVRLPTFTVNCYGCGICEKLCPQKAIEIGPEENGKRLIYITPRKCTDCGLCASACPCGGMRGSVEIKVPHLERLPLVRIESQSCELCSRPVPPGTKLCPLCSRKK